jgi:hypothetical protein
MLGDHIEPITASAASACAARVSTVGKIASQVPSQPGRVKPRWVDPLEHGGHSVLQPQVLEEQNDLEPFTVDGGEAKQDQTGQPAGACEQLAETAMMVSDPAGPVDAGRCPRPRRRG